MDIMIRCTANTIVENVHENAAVRITEQKRTIFKIRDNPENYDLIYLNVCE